MNNIFIVEIGQPWACLLNEWCQHDHSKVNHDSGNLIIVEVCWLSLYPQAVFIWFSKYSFTRSEHKMSVPKWRTTFGCCSLKISLFFFEEPFMLRRHLYKKLLACYIYYFIIILKLSFIQSPGGTLVECFVFNLERFGIYMNAIHITIQCRNIETFKRTYKTTLIRFECNKI